ncbi:flavin-containing monooxygenase [Nocardia bovistercoris]|uniref:NAD(P)/FAD-dependent oxidoreductase n=1 Tax=Nocardia bovistercoris TaxID=2785916 RepID=A0A931IAH4_9NOCA|nr:NAD(P)/FAD-dependent oxidoreductase [Nocardia bovistercoris]MBH0777854.1 NAD(P)/FAD-dependent oxidoreductase [Nocardia bovistercoris]
MDADNAHRDIRIAVIGAGFGGLCAAMKLDERGYRNLTVYDRAPDVGGTWQANTYPGAACDAPSHLYSYSFDQDVDWSYRFAHGPEIQRYLGRCADRAGLRHRIRTDTEVTRADWDGGEWALTLGDGSVERADVLIPALGHLCVPVYPPLPGRADFAGDVFHTARWNHDVDLRGKSVAVIGTGSSAIQTIPAIADTVGKLTVFQRTAPYVMYKLDAPYTERTHRFYRRFGFARKFARGAIWGYFEFFNYAFWRFPGAMALLRRVHGRQLRKRVSDPALRAALTPDYAIGCKRILLSSDYYATLNRPDVDLVTEPITAITPKGVATATGTHEVDVIVFATGFETSEFLSSIEIGGRDGKTLREQWSERAAAYLGLAVPNFPNMFLIWGPNTNLGAGSIVSMIETQAEHIVRAVERIAESPGTTVEVTTEAYDAFLGEIRAREPKTIWAGCDNWYRDEHGNDIHNWPGSMRDYRNRTRRALTPHYRVTAPTATESHSASGSDVG